jgi:hypothetical protein
VWLVPDGSDLDAHVAPLLPAFEALALQEHEVLATSDRRVEANWKFVVEGFLEGYHIRTTHKETFYPYGFDNLTLLDTYGLHGRVVFPFKRVLSLAEREPAARRLRRCCTVVHQVFPNVIVAAQPYTMAVVMLEPLGVGETRVRQVVLVDPAESPDKAREDLSFLARGLDEDMEMACAVHARAAAMRGETLLFGAFEGLLAHFHAGLYERVGA